MTSETKTCQDCKQPFAIEPEDFDFYKKIGVSPPTFCPDCRLQRRFAFRNERSLYRRKCDLTGESVVSLYPESAPFPVYSQRAWWSDEWDAKSYGRDFDFSRPFFEQFAELYNIVPRLSLMNRHCVNSDYCPWSIYYKNSFLCVSGNTCEDCYYDFFVIRSRDVFDSSYTRDSELCYECIDSMNVYRSAWCKQCTACTNSWFCEDCNNCSNCFGCVGLRNKENRLFNKELSKEEWEREVGVLIKNLPQQFRTVRARVEELKQSLPRRYAQIFKSRDCTGDYLINSTNAKFCYDAAEVEDVRYFTNGDYIKGSYDVNYFIKSERCYEGLSLPNSYNTHFSVVCWDNRDVYYSDHCFDSSDLFGCIGLRKTSHCILNKQYTSEEYGRLVPQIIAHMRKTGEWGEFFPAKLSPFGYDETVANDYFPMSEGEAEKKGFRWTDLVSGLFGKETLKPGDVPENIMEVADSITNEILACEKCNKNFKIIPQELVFYKRMGLPMPRFCPDCRHRNRLAARNPRKLWRRKCECGGALSVNGVYKNTTQHPHGSNKCPNGFETTFSPERKEVVYCEQCYQVEVA